MLKHYFLIATRNLAKQKILAAINIFSLSIGIACFSLILLYAINEFNFDRFHKDSGNIYRAYRLSQPMDGSELSADVYMPMPLGPAMKQELPGIKNYVRMQEGWRGSFVKSGDQIIQVPVSFADPEFFTVFSFPLRYGSATSVLKDLHDVVLTQKTAEKLFGKVNPVGKTIQIKT